MNNHPRPEMMLYQRASLKKRPQFAVTNKIKPNKNKSRRSSVPMLIGLVFLGLKSWIRMSDINATYANSERFFQYSNLLYKSLCSLFSCFKTNIQTAQTTKTIFKKIINSITADNSFI